MLFRTLLVTSALVLTTACSGDELADAKDKASDSEEGEGGNLSDLLGAGAEKAKAQVDELASGMVAKLGEVKDAATASKAAEDLQGMLGTLQGLKTTLGDKMPSLSTLMSAATSLKEKFTDNPAVMQALKPILDSIAKLSS